MTRRVLFGLLSLLALPSLAQAQAIVADHTTLDIASIPNATIAAAANLRLVVRRASVGGNISGGLDALRASNARYDRSRWVFSDRGNPGWQPKVDDLVSFTAANASSYDVFSMKFCYIDPDASFTYYRDAMLGLETTYPTKRFIWWTIPIETSGNTNRQSFNDQVRAYARANGKLLFDVADIESHNASNQKRTDSSGRELMWGEWTSDGGHLSSAGAQRVATAWWWLMAQIASRGALSVTAVTPSAGSTAGGTPVSITGTGFVSGATVSMGGTAATNVVFDSATRLTATTPAHAAGAVAVSVTNPGGSSASLAGGFTYTTPIPLVSISDVTITEGDSGSKTVIFEVTLVP